jgi:sialic acid synthase
MFIFNKAESDSFVIAEVGQNHNGDLDTAREYIKVFAEKGADAVKFQTRNNRYLFSDEAYNKSYNSDNAFAETYGAHREILELDPEYLPILKADCERYGVRFMSTPFDEPSLALLTSVGVDLIKLASFDLGNLPFITRAAATGVPIVISVGGGNFEQIRASVETILSYHNNLAVLHCVSEYPCAHNRLGLENISLLKEAFPQVTVGSSDHFNGILSGPVAYMLGARVFEKHVTLNRASRGTDHSFSLEPHGFESFVRDIKRVPEMMPTKSADDLGQEYVFQKLGKSITAARDIEAGVVITVDDLTGCIYDGHFIPVRESLKVLGKIAKSSIRKGEPLTYNKLQLDA